MKSDFYLFHTFNAQEKERDERERERSEQDPTRFFRAEMRTPKPVLLPMLIRVDETWNVENVPDCHITSRIGDIVACLGSMRTVEALEKDPAVISIEASRPDSGLDCAQSVPFVKADTIHQLPEKGDRALIAIIDGGIDVLHEAFTDSSGSTRILAVWDQSDITGPAPRLPGGGIGYGTEHTQADIDAYISTGVVPPGLGRDVDGHGTHVASIAAGRAVGAFTGGVAPEAKIIVVRSRITVGPTDPYSTGYSTSHADALTYIKKIAKEQGLPVVVNVSQGMNAGAHDGTSLVEAAFDNFSGGGRQPGYVVVKSAGNERGEHGHAKVSMGNNGSDSLEWDCDRSNRRPVVVELWFKACDEFEFVLRDPKGTRTPSVTWVNPAETGQFRVSNNDYQIDYVRYHRDNGDSRLLVTVTRGSSPFVQSGRWALEVSSKTVRSAGEIHAWIERDNRRLVRFASHTNEDMTLSVPGTARSVISVGSVDSNLPLKLDTHSAYGPTRDEREKPELVAPGQSITAAKGGTANDVRPESGTSMAAPHVTGAIALLFSHWGKKNATVPNWEQLNTAQIRAAISQVTQNFSGRWTPGMGYGVLDVEALLAEFP
jgi:endonuclease G